MAASWKWVATGVRDYDETVLYTGDAILYAYKNGETESEAIAVDVGYMVNGAISPTLITIEDAVRGNQYYFYYTMVDSDDNTFKSSTKQSTAMTPMTSNLVFGNGGSWSPVGSTSCIKWIATGITEPNSQTLYSGPATLHYTINGGEEQTYTDNFVNGAISSPDIGTGLHTSDDYTYSAYYTIDKTVE